MPSSSILNEIWDRKQVSFIHSYNTYTIMLKGWPTHDTKANLRDIKNKIWMKIVEWLKLLTIT